MGVFRHRLDPDLCILYQIHANGWRLGEYGLINCDLSLEKLIIDDDLAGKFVYRSNGRNINRGVFFTCLVNLT